jgi:predicted PurR-regulated permease PerM
VWNAERKQQIFLAILGLAAFGLAIYIARPFIGPLLAALAIAILAYPVHLKLTRKLRNPDLAAAVSMLLVILLLVIPAILLGVALINEAQDLYQVVQNKTAQSGDIRNELLQWGTNFFHRTLQRFGVQSVETEQQIRDAVVQKVQELGGVALNLGQSIVGNLAELIGSTVINLFALFFLFRDGLKIRQKLIEKLPLKTITARRLFGEIGQSVVANFYGIIAVAIAQGALTGFIFLVLGLPSPVLWGAAGSLFSMVPVVGPTVIWVPAAIFLAAKGLWVKAAILTGFGVGVIGLADNFIRPYVVSGKVDLHPLLVFISLLGGVQAFGFLGLFIGPAIVTLVIVILELLEEPAESPVANLYPPTPTETVGLTEMD